MISDALSTARAFGRSLNTKFASRNVEFGITTDQVIVLADMLSRLNILLDSGSMETAYEEIEHNVPINVSPFWDASIRNYYMSAVAAFLQGLDYNVPVPPVV
jgi:hypothetical protein